MYFYTMNIYDSRRLKKVSRSRVHERSNGYVRLFSTISGVSTGLTPLLIRNSVF
jgi:hypothetical protein